MLACISESEELISKVSFDFSELNVMFTKSLFQWYKSKRTTVMFATTLTLLPVSAACSAHGAVSVSASSSLFPDLIS